ncbi:hypothetical protein TcBrA4_0021730 [Trypanosoma cruzi]|nr:hypothetical protein TcBrA4_0021730 [Trypanosoma cruzi]
MLSRHVSTRIGDSLRRLTDPTPSIGVPHPTRRPTCPRRGLSLPPIERSDGPECIQQRPSLPTVRGILVAPNASGIMSVTYGGREHVAADNTDEVSEHDTTGHKSLVLENGVAGSGFVAGGDADGLSQRNASGHENPNCENSPRSIPESV